MASEIVGRDEELAASLAFLESDGAGTRMLVLEGAAGIGKSTIWLAALERAHEQGLRVLRSRPAEAERALDFAGLGDLLEPVLDEFLPALPRPRRAALEAALLLEQPSDAVDPRTLGVAVRSALEALGEISRLLVAIDDVQWLDPSSSAALSFALRRTDTPARVLLTRRLADGIDPSALERALGPDATQSLRVGPLSPGAIQAILRERLGRAFPRPVLMRVHEVSGGNPFYALELGRALGPEADATKPLPVPDTLDELVGTRLASLPDATRDALVLVAAHGSPSASLLRLAGVDESVLEPALASRVVELTPQGFRFEHPLLASAAYQGRSETTLRVAHRALAEVVTDPVEQALHLARSTDEPDPRMAASFDAAAEVASARGATVAGVELREHALRLTPSEAGSDLRRRSIAAARAHVAVADIARARSLVHELLSGVEPGVPRAEALILASELSQDPAAALDLLREALAEAADDPRLQARIHQTLGWNARFIEGLEVAERHAQASLTLAEALGDDALRAGALATLSAIRFHLAEPDAIELGERALEVARSVGDTELLVEATLMHSSTLLWTLHLDRARALLETLLADWEERDEGIVDQIVWRLGFVEVALGRLDSAADYVEQAAAINRQYGDSDDAMRWAVALVAFHRGDVERAGRVAERGLASSRVRNPWFHAYFEGVLGQIARWSGDVRTAVEHFAVAEEASRAVGSREPNLARWRADHAEALIELGRLEAAVALVGPWEAEARRLGRDVVVAQATRCRGLMAAARGDIEGALALLEEAADLHAGIPDPLGRGRALVALGVVRRRARQKRAARDAIEEAVALFEDCGADGWAERARAELGRISGRTREVGLTAAERRVASLVARGKTNREVAAELVLGQRTVETHLSHVYAKLGVRSRTELARAYEPGV